MVRFPSLALGTGAKSAILDCLLSQSVVSAFWHESQHTRSNTPSISSPVVDEEKTRPGHSVVSALCFFQWFDIQTIKIVPFTYV